MFCFYGKYKYLYFEVRLQRGALMGHCPAWCLVHLPLKEPPTCLLTGPNTKLTSTHAEPSLYTKTMQNCFLFLAILCNKSTNHLLPILVVVYLKMSCSFLLALSFDESTIYCVLSELYPKVNISYTHT